jgi:hypothetical protein
MHLGRYEIIRELGRGAMGAVYEARDPHIDRTVAIKTIAVQGASAAEEEQYRKRFFREAQAAGKFTAAGIVSIYDVGQDEATHTPYIVMEFVPGQTLDQYVAAAGGRLPRERALQLLEQVATALDYAHAQGIVHRDIKPANIMVTAEGQAKIADFGIAKVTAADFTMTGQVLGTPSYMSPEQLSGAKAIDGRSDLFSLGVMAYWLLTGRKPFQAENTTSLAFQIVYKDPPRPCEVNTELGPEFDYLLKRLLAKDPAERYQRGRDCAADLEDMRQGRQPRSLTAAGAPSAEERTTVVTPAVERTVTQAPPDAAMMQTTPLGALAVEPTPPLPAAPAWRERLLRLPKYVWIAAAAVIVLVVALALLPGTHRAGIFPRVVTGTAELRLTGRHAFRSANLTVWIDDQQVYQGKLEGTVHQRSSFLSKRSWVSGDIDVPIRVPAGKHTVTIKIEALEQNYLQTSTTAANFAANSSRTLRLGFGRAGKELNLDWQ